MDANRHKLITAIQQRTALLFIQGESVGDLCYAHNNNDLRDEFKQSFSAQELDFYCRSFAEATVQPPKDATEFWLRVRRGVKEN